MTVQLPVSTDVQRAKLSARDFWLLADAGAFEGFAKSELIEGEIWVVNSVWAWHSRTMAFFTIELGFALRAAGSDLIVYGSGSVDLSDDSVPEPDVSIGMAADGRGIPAEKMRLAVEVSDSTLRNDLVRKAPLYARYGVPEYWVVDREGRRVVQMWEASPDGYLRREDIAFSTPIRARTIAGIDIDTSGITS